GFRQRYRRYRLCRAVASTRNGTEGPSRYAGAPDALEYFGAKEQIACHGDNEGSSRSWIEQRDRESAAQIIKLLDLPSVLSFMPIEGVSGSCQRFVLLRNAQ